MKALEALALIGLLVSTPGVAAARDPLATSQIELAGFLRAHPDIKNRRLGIEQLEAGQPQRAFEFFMEAARLADKPSQAMLGEMYWEGNGVARDPVMGYIWMDIAAERGYRAMVAWRERYWGELSPAQRQRALSEGVVFFDEYGDAAAQPRMVQELRRAKSRITGSRTGMTTNVKIYMPAGASKPSMDDATVDATVFYDDDYWEPERYFEWTDAQWENAPVSKGEVEVRSPELIDPNP